MSNSLTKDWMWNDNGEVWSIGLDLEREIIEWSDSIGCACSGGFAQQSFADFRENGPRYGQPPADVVAEIQAVLHQLGV